MLSETRQMGLPAPQFREMSEFLVTFRKAPADITQTESAPPEEDKPQQLVLDALPATVSFSSPRKTVLPDLDKRRVIAMRYVQEHGSITNREYRELTGASEQTANRDLEALAEQGGLVRVGEKRGRRYKLP